MCSRKEDRQIGVDRYQGANKFLDDFVAEIAFKK